MPSFCDDGKGESRIKPSTECHEMVETVRTFTNGPRAIPARRAEAQSLEAGTLSTYNNGLDRTCISDSTNEGQADTDHAQALVSSCMIAPEPDFCTIGLASNVDSFAGGPLL